MGRTSLGLYSKLREGESFLGRVGNRKFWGIDVNGPGLVKVRSAPDLRTTPGCRCFGFGFVDSS